MTNRFTLTCIGICAVLTMSFRCEKEVVAPLEHTFEIPVSITPLQKSYHITDTIWLETDVSGKSLLDTKTNLTMNADTGKINFRVNYNPFADELKNPQNGFCDVITNNTVNTNRTLASWSTAGFVTDYGCGQSSYRTRIGFKPNYKGMYYLILQNDLLQSCPNKVVPYNSSLGFKYKQADLNLDIFNSLSKTDQGGNDGVKFYTQKINNRELFVFKVE